MPIRIRKPIPGRPFEPRKKPLQDRSSVLVDAIVEASIRILERDGWPGLTTTAVARRAGVSVGSLYQYFPNREAIVVELLRRRTRRLVEAVLGADLSSCSGPAEGARCLMAAFVSEKQAMLGLSLALRDILPAVQGRSVIVEEARRYLPALEDKLSEAGLRTSDTTRIGLALVAIESAGWEFIARDADALSRPETVETLAGLLLASVGAIRV